MQHLFYLQPQHRRQPPPLVRRRQRACSDIAWPGHKLPSSEYQPFMIAPTPVASSAQPAEAASACAAAQSKVRTTHACCHRAPSSPPQVDRTFGAAGMLPRRRADAQLQHAASLDGGRGCGWCPSLAAAAPAAREGPPSCAPRYTSREGRGCAPCMQPSGAPQPAGAPGDPLVRCAASLAHQVRADAARSLPRAARRTPRLSSAWPTTSAT